MSKYYDMLVKMNENLDKELMEKGIVNSEITANDVVVKNDKVDLVKEDDGDGDTIEIPKDSLTPEQKKDILLDKGVDQKAIDNLKDDSAIDGALDATLNNDEVMKNESGEEADISEEVVIRMDDDDLDLHGYVKAYDGKGIELVDDESDAQVFQHEELGQNAIEAICSKFHYDPSTFKTISLDPRADEPYEDDEPDNDNFGENWVSIDPMNPSATTLP